jgi:CDP-diacylglycerol--glycerol-3-phosphate 3-phosphatidyltransferase
MENETDDLQIDNLPNRLTILRVILIPVVIGCLMLAGSDSPYTKLVRSQMGWLAAIIFALASVTDFFDGYIARKRNIVTVFGSFLDPIADKFLVVSSLIMLQALGRIPVIVVIILVLREMYITSLRLLAMKEGIQVPVGQAGKWKTLFQMVGVALLMANQPLGDIPIPQMGTAAIYIASFLSLWSAIHYSSDVIKKMKLLRVKRREEKKLSKKQH